jgi:hypothetical protein
MAIFVGAIGWEIARFRLQRSDIMGDPPISKSSSENWENEGGSLPAADYAKALGISRILTETYAVGGYSYTNLADAIAQARRMQKKSGAL